jgi:hypothetical protein
MYVMCAVLYQKMNQVSGKFSVYVWKFDLEREPVATNCVNKHSPLFEFKLHVPVLSSE